MVWLKENNVSNTIIVIICNLYWFIYKMSNYDFMEDTNMQHVYVCIGYA